MSIDRLYRIFELGHSKMYNWACERGEIQISLHIHSDQSLCCLFEESFGPWLPIKCLEKTLIRLSLCWTHMQAFKWALLFPSFLICSYFSLLFHENALLSLLFHSKMSFTHKNPEIFPRSLRSLVFYKLTSMFIQGAHPLTLQFLMFNLKVSLFG